MKKIAIITGATGGIGKEFVKLLLLENIDEIWCIARNNQKLNLLKEELGNKIIPIPLDLSLNESIIEIEKLLNKESIKVLYLINNAGIGEILGAYNEIPINKTWEIIQINCNAVAALCTLCIPYMQKNSRIINLSSQSSFQPVPYLNLYASTKAFVTSFTRALNIELKKLGITATAICAGWTDTEMLPKKLNGKDVKYPGIIPAKLVAIKGLNDAKKGKDMSVCTVYVKYMRLLSKIFPHKMVMKTWMRSISKYL